jgi:hypothetical protein
VSKKMHLPNFLPFVQCPYTDEPLVHWLMLQDYIAESDECPPMFDYDADISQQLGNGLALVREVCTRAEAMNGYDILYKQAGADVLQILLYGRFRDRDGQIYPYTSFFARSRDQLIELCRWLSIPTGRREMRRGEWFAAADYAVNAKLIGSDFLHYAQVNEGDAILRLVVHEAIRRFNEIMKSDTVDVSFRKD